MTDRLNDLLKSLGIASQLLRDEFIDHCTVSELPKNTDILVAGKTNASEYILVSGVAHRYTVSDKGDPITTGFYGSGAVITPHFARTQNGRNLFSLQTLTDAVLAQIPVNQLDRLRATHADYREFGQRVLENELVQALQFAVSFRSFSAKERLVAMRTQYPNLENLVPHHIIASYLGITPVSFSRLRHELSRA
ncbi:Crp/Fnr family transcriptional regulator [Rudanella paleaurantiibacter]|uniref:Crp/Fnr family transcriptional regulator n=1 Tax=Rudanella paleaurantiibacter TaxID=2614655 RepID=A0A7J5TZE7_9BACT|nr:Crp/Fnr family transcriptional regulator [Rudanella paleaurantiibacter]KAB7730431.1 Crp/Fnr family transcriptional regulator [Rudanella paleaurantiibacter]